MVFVTPIKECQAKLSRFLKAASEAVARLTYWIVTYLVMLAAPILTVIAKFYNFRGQHKQIESQQFFSLNLGLSVSFHFVLIRHLFYVRVVISVQFLLGIVEVNIHYFKSIKELLARPKFKRIIYHEL